MWRRMIKMGGGLDILVFNNEKKEYLTIQATNEGGKIRLRVWQYDFEDINYDKLAELYENNKPILGALINIKNPRLILDKLLDNQQQFIDATEQYVKNSRLLNFIKNKVPGTYCINHYTIIEE